MLVFLDKEVNKIHGIHGKCSCHFVTLKENMFGPTTLTVDIQLILKGLFFAGWRKKKHNKLKQNLVGGFNPFERY